LLAVPDDASGSAALLATGARQHDGTVSSLWPAAGAIAASLAEGADRPWTMGNCRRSWCVQHPCSAWNTRPDQDFSDLHNDSDTCRGAPHPATVSTNGRNSSCV